MATGGVDAAESMLLTLIPGARVCVVVGHHVYAVALPLVFGEEALISAAISPGVDPEASDFAVQPFTCELSLIGPCVFSEPVDLAVNPVPIVSCSVLPLVQAETVLLAVGVSSFEAGAIWPSLNTYAFLSILKPLSLVLASVAVFGDSLSVTHVVVPFA